MRFGKCPECGEYSTVFLTDYLIQCYLCETYVLIDGTTFVRASRLVGETMRENKAFCDGCGVEIIYGDLFKVTISNIANKTSASKDICKLCANQQIQKFKVQSGDWKEWNKKTN